MEALDVSRIIARVLAPVRWVTIVAIFLLSLSHPLTGRLGEPTWMLVVIFAGYSAAADVIRRRFARWRSPTARAFLDLLVVTALYIVAASPGGPVFALFVLVTVSAACTTTLPRGIAFTAGALLVLAVISPTLPMWRAGPISVRDLIVRLIVVALASLGAAALTWQLKQERIDAREAAERARLQEEYNERRDTFVALISHELRTPLTALRAGMGMLELSLNDRMRADEMRLLGTARRNSERLGLLVDDLLTFNQIEAGALRLEHEPVDLGDVARHAVRTVSDLIAEKGQSVRVEIEGQFSVVGDARRLEQAVLNLVANAHEHTPAGSHIDVAAHATRDEIVLTVSDDGPGIASDDYEQIFDRFYRLDRANNKGSGLGLAVAKSIVELHKGRLWAGAPPQPAGDTRACPAEGAGTRGAAFCLALPRQVMEHSSW